MLVVYVWYTCVFAIAKPFFSLHFTPLHSTPRCCAMTSTAVAFLVIPYEHSHWDPLLQRLLPLEFFASCGYNPISDRTANLMMMSAILGYMVTSGFCSLLDLVSPKEWKCQGSKSYLDLKTWGRVVGKYDVTCVYYIQCKCLCVSVYVFVCMNNACSMANIARAELCIEVFRTSLTTLFMHCPYAAYLMYTYYRQTLRMCYSSVSPCTN